MSKRKSNKKPSADFLAYWAGSASQLVINDYKSGNVVTIVAGTSKGAK